MNKQELMNAASSIIKNNLTSRVVAATVDWDDEISKITLTYYINGAETDDDIEFCELSLTELLAEFSDIRLAASQCINAKENLGKLEGVVYMR
ncbi:hypothetical protein [Massilia sp. NR 4-1]|uniref:hypothetical protein n=1 Tax=Massilia sp. NR 4-1 TaxID=1678028 RepID=UPI00067B5DB1|nr:hypothetical protein [Massilia sp. NR 4-1]AKU21151.1 hypothetical protein ACZ75_06315 [Massilia sp. NR 4-1]